MVKSPRRARKTARVLRWLRVEQFRNKRSSMGPMKDGEARWIFRPAQQVPSDDVSTTATGSKAVHAPRFDVKTDDKPRRAADRVRQGHAARPLSASGRKLPGPVRARRRRLFRRRRPRAARLRLHLEAVVHAGDAGAVQRRHRPRPADQLLSEQRQRQPRRHRRAPGTRTSGWRPRAAASAPIGAASAASASRSDSTARPAASSRSSG